MSDEVIVEEKEVATAGAEESSAVVEKSFLDTLPEEYQSNTAFKNFKSVEDLARSYASASKMLGMDKATLLKLPNEDTPEAWGEVYNKIGRPDTPEGYDISDFKDVEGIDKDALSEFAKMAHENGITQKGFKSAVGYYLSEQAKLQEAFKEQTDKQIAEWQDAVKKEFGQAYDEKLSLAKKAVENSGIEGLKEAISDNWQVFEHPAIIKMLAAFGQSISEDSGLQTRGSVGSGKLTPAEARMRIAEIQNSPEYLKLMKDNGNPLKEAKLKELSALYEQANA